MTQKRVLLFFAFIFGFQVFEQITWRNDYPFTRWGMYSELDVFEPYYDFRIRTAQGHREIDLFKNPWQVRRILEKLSGLKQEPHWRSKSIEQVSEAVLFNLHANSEEVRNLIEKNMSFSQSKLEVRLFFRAWRELSPDRIHEPDIEKEVIF